MFCQALAYASRRHACHPLSLHSANLKIEVWEINLLDITYVIVKLLREGP